MLVFKKLKNSVGKVGKRPEAKSVAVVCGIIVVFALGMLTGNGTIRNLLPNGRGNETGLPATIDYSQLNEEYQALRENYDGKLTETQIIDGLKHGLAESANDPYTEYQSASEAKTFTNDLNGTFTGIGAQLEQDSNDNIVVVAPIPGSPAEKAGIRAQDIIAAINGQSTSGLNINQAVEKIRGPKGTKVTLGIVRGGSQALTITVTRSNIQSPTASGKMLDGTDIGYLQITQFGSDTFTKASQAVTKLQQQGAKKIILDLRDNGGGEVDIAQDIASMWLKPGAEIMQARRGSVVDDTVKATGDDPLIGIPTVVLINGGSASASEITALALHDNKAATLIGEKSYGKGVMQAVIPLRDGGALKVTTDAWYPPSGKSINKKGITPDKTVPMTDADYTNHNDVQLQAAEAFLNGR